MAFKSNEIKVGAIVVASILVLGLFLAAIFGTRFSSETKTYQTYLEYAGGLGEGTLVKYRGFNVGQITEIVLPTADEPRIGLRIEIEEDTPVRIDSRAYISAVGMMSESHLEISAGSPGADLLPAGSVISGKEVLSFTQMAEMMGQLSERTQDLMLRVSDLFNDENRGHIAAMLENSGALVQESRQPFLEALSGMEQTSRELTKMTQKLAEISDSSDTKIAAILSNLEKTTGNAQLMITEMSKTLQGMQRTMASNNRNIREITENFEAVSQNMAEFSRMIKEQPWLLVRKSAPPERKIK